MFCKNCGSALSSQVCDFCGTVEAEVAQAPGSGPVAQPLGEGFELERTFSDSQRVHDQAVAHSLAMETHRLRSARALRWVVTALLGLSLLGGLYYLFAHLVLSESALNAAVMRVSEREYPLAHHEAARAANILSLEVEPVCLDGAIYVLEAIAPGKYSPSPEECYPMARFRLEKAAKLEPDYGPSHFYLGVVYVQQGERAMAVAEFERTLGLLNRADGRPLTAAFADASTALLAALHSNQTRFEFYSGAPTANGQAVPSKEGAFRVPFGRYPPD
ncbi:MAG: hypothetical protein AB7S38_06000 [Vulcanimicrobiota bacterium]